MGLFATLRNAVKWAGFDLGRADKAVAQAVVLVDPETGEAYSASGGGGSGGSSSDRELVVTTYRVKTAFTGASVGDTITGTQIIDVTEATPSTVSTIWRNQTTAADLASAPDAANLELVGSNALTAAQLAVAGLATEASVASLVTAANKFTFTGSNQNVNIAAQSFSYSANNSTNGNSSAYTLASGASWNGTLENTINQNYAVVAVNSTRAVTLTISQFIDLAGTIKEVPDIVYSIAANVPYATTIAVEGNYVRLSVSNASGASATLYVDTYYGPLLVAPDSLTQLGNFKNSINEVGGVATTALGIPVAGRTGQPSVTPSVTAGAYVAGNVVGGLMTFANAFAGSSGVLQSIIIKCKSVQSATFKLYLFSQQPTNTTWTDKTAPAINVNDLPFLIDVFIFAAPDSGLGTMTIYTQDGLGKALSNTAGGTQLFGILVTTGTPTFASTSDVSVALGIIQD